MRNKIGVVEGITKISFEQASGGPPVGKPVNVAVIGDDYEKIYELVKIVEEKLKGIKGVSDVDDTYVLGKEELLVRIDRAEAAAAGLNLVNIGTTVRAAYEGVVATSIKKLDEEIEIRVTLSERNRSTANSISDLHVLNQTGRLIPISKVTNIEHDRKLASLRHEKYRRVINVVADVDTDIISSTQANKKLKELMQPMLKDFPDLKLSFGGENEDTEESMGSLARTGGAAILGIGMILLGLFKSVRQSLLVLSTIPLGVISVIWTFYLHGKPLSFLGMIGVIALAGVIVNNAIVLIDFVNQLRREGEDRLSSVRKAARTRLRPITLTTITTTAGILPTAYGVGGTDPFVTPIALALGYGVLFGAVLTTIFLPVFLVVTDDISVLLARKFKRQ